MAIGYTPGQLTPTQAEAKPGSTHESGIRYPGLLSDRSTPLTKTQDWMQILELLYRRLSMTMGLHCEATENALEVAVYAGVYAKSDGTKVAFAEHAAFSVPDDTTDYKLWVLASTNALTGGTSWPSDSTTYVAVAMVTTASGAVTEITDARGYNSLRIVPTYTDNGQTSQSEFLIDADAASAGDRYLSMQLGAALWAALKWVNTGGYFELYSDKDVTLAGLNLLAVLISGTVLLDADGAAKVTDAVAGDGLAHSAGVLSVGVDDATIEIDSDELGVKDQGIGLNQVSGAIRQAVLSVDMQDAAGDVTGGVNVTIQVKDLNGDNFAGECLLEVGAFTDADGSAFDTNVTITIVTGSIVRTIADYDKVIKTDSSGTAVITVTRTTGDDVYVLAKETWKSRALNCVDAAFVDHT